MSEKNSANPASKPGFFASLAQRFRKDPDPKPEDADLSEFAKIAQDKGYIDGNQAEQLTDLAADDLENTSSDLVVQEGWMTESQAEVVCIEQAKTNPRAHQDDLFRRAEKELGETHTEILRLKDVTAVGSISVADVMAAKKAKG